MLDKLINISFRGKSKKSEKWVYGGISYNQDKSKWFIEMVNKNNVITKVEVIPESVGQQWEIAQNTEVYTGDYFRAKCNPTGVKSDIHEIDRLCKAGVDSRGIIITVWYKRTWLPCGAIVFVSAKVVGNIIDNPELLEPEHIKYAILKPRPNLVTNAQKLTRDGFKIVSSEEQNEESFSQKELLILPRIEEFVQDNFSIKLTQINGRITAYSISCIIEKQLGFYIPQGLCIKAFINCGFDALPDGLDTYFNISQKEIKKVRHLLGIKHLTHQPK